MKLNCCRQIIVAHSKMLAQKGEQSRSDSDGSSECSCCTGNMRYKSIQARSDCVRLRHVCIVVVIISSLLTPLIHAQDLSLEQVSESICKSQRTCGDCITAEGSCAWCKQEVFDVQSHTRCATQQSLKDAGCPEALIVQPKPSLEYIKDNPLSDAGGQLQGDAVQIYPQEINIKLRPNTPFTIPIEFRQAEDYPVDLYYLMDLSKSMEDDKQKLATLGDLLSERMSQITSNFQLGFGSFVDKTVMPFVNTVPEKLRAPCKLEDDRYCAPPYGFKHHMTLTQDTSKFKGEVLDAPVSGNLDSPEGGFDAIMQAIVCESEIGWRRAARRLLIFSTDAGFHYAGDGKLGGIVAPNDGQCHLDSRGYYTASMSQDYPSISQLIERVSNKSVNVIFAVSGDKLPVYRKLSDMIDGSSSGRLANDSSNIVELVQENYDKITSRIKLIDYAPDHVKISYKSTCLGTASEVTNECGGLKVGSTVTFNASLEVELSGCSGSRRQFSFVIKPADLADELKVNVELDCDCDCEAPINNEPNSPKCSGGNGTFECGQCTCYPGYFGRLCECSSSNPAIDDYDAMCRDPNSTSPNLCSGRGDCRCGDCQCYAQEVKGKGGKPQLLKSYGQYCQCDDSNCPRGGGQLCSGTHGVCKCRKCVCNEGWKGEACQCPDDGGDSCRAKSGEMCNGRGICKCGVCQCDPQSGFRGPTCEDCPTCEGQCDDQRYCVECHAFGTGKYSDKAECEERCPVVPVMKDTVEERKEEGIRLCQFPASDGCRFYFIYQYNDTQHLIIHVQKTRVCPEPVNTGAIIAAVVGGIVAIGLALLLIWKLLTTIHDRREFAKFEKERQNARWDTAQNPIFKQATTTFKNPTYAPGGGGGGYMPVPS